MSQFIALIIVLSFSVLMFAGHTFSSKQSKILQGYLSNHQGYRLASSQDCKCDEDIQNMRKGYGGLLKPVPDYFPYRAVGDFNSDGQEDFAAVFVDGNKNEKPFILVIFNGPLNKVIAKPAFEERQSDLSHYGLFFGPPRPAPYRLLLGPFESDAGGILIPKGKTYVWG